MDGASELIYATAIAVAGRAVLIRGPSGSGKSDLALRCIVTAPSVIVQEAAMLVADDQVVLTRRTGRLYASAPPAIAGKFEVRGIGIVTVPFKAEAEVVLVADITARESIDRLPDPWPETALLQCQLPVLRIAAFEPSAPSKLLVALALPALPNKNG